MAAIIGTNVDEEELRREAERIAEEGWKKEEAEAEKSRQDAEAAAAANEQAARDAGQKAKEATEKAQRQGFDRTVREYSKGVGVDIIEAGEFTHLPENLEEERKQLEKANRAGEMGRGTSFGVVNEIDVDYGSIKSPDQAVFFATTLATDADKLKFFKEYAKRSGQNYESVLAYADDRLGTKIFAAPQSNAGKREAMTSALEGIGLFDINGNDVKVGTADFDTIVQSLNNIADEDKAKKAAAYVESLTKIPGSPYYGMTFDKDTVAYRDSANLPSQTYKDEVKALGGSFYTGKEAFAGNMETYLAKYEELQAVYGGDPFAFRQVERALKDAYEKQTGYRAPDSAQVQEIIEQTKAERALAAQAEAAESNKGFFDKVADAWNKIFPKEKKEEEEEIAPVDAEAQTEQPYAFRSGYVASAGPMSSGLLAENDRIAEAVESAAPQAEATAVEAPAAAEELPEMQGPAYQPKPVDKVEVTQNQPPMTYMQAMAAHQRGEELSPENEAIIGDSLKNDDFMRYVVNGMTPDPQQIMQERAYGGTVLSDAQARIRANSMTTGRQILGTTLGSVAEALGTGAMPEDVIGAGYQLMADLMNGVSREIRSGRIAVPAGENKYDYVIANTPRLQKQAEQLAGLQKEVEGIMATRAIEAAHDYDKKVEDAEIRYLKGIATQEDLMMLHSRANPNADINDDETRMQFLAQLSGRSMWYQDDGAFWKGDSAAAQAGMRLRETRADGQYGDFKNALWDKAHDVIDELTYIAMDHGMTLGGWMEKVGLNIDDPSDIMDMAYNRIEAEGAKIAGDQEAQDAANALANVQTQGVGWLGARWGGFKHGLADDAYHFMNAGYLMMDAATYDARRNEIYNECVSEYGSELAPKVRRQILIAYANSGAMGKEKSQELLEDIERCDSIWDIPVDVDPGMIEGLYLSGLNEIDKYVEELESVRELLPENEAKAWDRYFGHGANVGAGFRQVATQSLAMAAGVPYSVAKNIGLVFGHGFSSFSKGTKKYEDAGLPIAAAMYMGGAEAFGMIMVNALGDDTVMSSLNGRSLMRNGMETAFRKGSWIGLAKEAAKKTMASAGTEAVQEVLEEGTSKTVEMFVPTAKALSNGEQVSFSKSLQMAWDEFKNMDGKTLYKDLLQAGWGGVVYGGFYAAVGMAFETPRSVANAKLQAQYPSIDIASQIAHGEIPANEENMGRFIDLMREDVQKPEFRALMDKKNDSADQASYVTVAAVLGEGKEFRDNALKLTQTANQYDQKAEAAEKAVEINRSQFYTARKAAMDGNQGAAVAMEGFRTAWAKAQTTATENRQAAQKKREEAAEQTGRWIYACRKLGDNMHSLTKVRAANLLMYKEQEAQADEMEPKLAEAEANVEAVGAEAFIEQNYNNASDAEKDHIREIYGVPVGTKKEEAPAATVSETENVAEQATEQEAPAAQEAPQTPSEALVEPVAQTTVEPAAEPVQSVQPATEASEAPVKPVQTMTGAQRLEANRKRQIDSATKFLGQVGRRFNVKTELAPADDKRLMLPKLDENGKPRYAPALYNRDTDTIIVSENASQGDILRAKIVHELTHRTEGTEAYNEFSKAVQAAYFKGNENNKTSFENSIRRLYASNGVNLSPEGLEHEVVSRITEELIGGNQEMVDRLVADSPSVARRIMDAIKTVLDRLRGVKGADVDQLRAVEKMFQKALDESMKQKKSEGVQHSIPDSVSPETKEVLTGTVGGDTVVQYSLSSWTPEEQNTVRSNLINHGYDEDVVDDWIDDVNSVAAIVAADRDRLDFEAADNQVMLKPNQEYVRTLDASTLCAKRLLYQGTFNAIQHRMPNKVMTSDDLIRLRNMMAEAGYETPCGICYVESRRRNLGTFAQKWLEDYDAKGGYQPKLDDVTTTDGLENMRTQHPEVYESFVNEMKRKGSNNPKVVQLRTDYRGDIRKLSKNDIDKIIKIGGLRVQSFSDFETPHLLDMMQAVLDMTENNLTSQAYTKVPNFAWVFGDTGIKINLSLIAEGDGFDADGNLAFSSYEGMDFDEAMRLRDRYSKNVGTILVGLSDKHIRAAMADPRIDFIIPFHKSGWGKRQLAQLSGMSGYMDYTRDQNERRIVGETKTGKPKTKNVEENFHPVDYWNYDLTGDQNAETYLRMCEEDGRIPKFSRFLTKDADGHWVAPSGYWKLLIDFKMYDNDGVGAPQMPVRPNFNMVEARRILGEYEGGANELPVAHDIVERFVNQTEQGNVQYSVNLDEDIEPDELTKYNKFGWIRANNALTPYEWTSVTSGLNSHKEHNVVWNKNKDGRLIVKTWDQKGRLGVIAITDEDPVNPTVDRVYKLKYDNDSELAEEAEEVILKYEQRWGYDALEALKPLVRFGGFEIHNAQDYRAYKLDDIPGRNGNNRNGTSQPSGPVQNGNGSTSGSGQSGSVNVQHSIDFPALPDDDFLRAEIDAWRSNPNYSVDDNTGKRQFANQTIQNNQYIPDYIKQAFLNDPTKANYSRESNMRLINAAWNRIQAEGYESARDRLVNQETKFDTDDNADALVLMRQALHDGDLDTLMSVATKYNTEGTDQAKALQIRGLMRTMTPTGFAQTVIQDVSRKIEDRETKRPGEKRRRERESKKTKENLNLGSLDDTSAADTLKSGGSIVIDTKFGASLNDAKRALIKEFDLEKTARPGDFYNWATTKQRMLEDILTTDDIWAKDSNGMDLVDRLVRMKHGEPVLTKADLSYITEQMSIFDRLADKNSREADLALARAHEAQGNINGVTGRMKRRTWRYVSMLLSVPSAIRNVIGNTAQSLPNSFADGIAVSLDQAISFVFGTERTRAHLSAKDRIEGWDAFRNEVFNTFRDYFVDKAVTQYGEGRYNQSQIGRVYQHQSLETLRHLEGLLMSVGDRTFWKKKFLNSMAEQQHLAEINGTAFDVEAAMETAEAEANYATFNEDSTVRNLMSALTEHIPFLDYLMPFVGVPTNIIKRQIEFSPIGIASTAIRHGWAAVRGESFDQRAFVDGMARGLTGSAMMGLGVLLLKSGFLKLGTKEEDDDKSYGVRTAQGDQYGVYFTIGDKNYSITTFSPAASALVAGAFFADAMGDNERWTQAMINATLKNINEIFDASYMSSLADALNTSNGKTFTENLIPAIGSAMITQNIPAPLTHLASALDPYVRDTKDKDAMIEVLNTTLNKIPGARQLLPKKVDVAGRAVENTKQGIAAFVDPFTTSYVNDDPALGEMIRLRDVLTDKGASEPRAHMASDALSGRKNTLTQNKVTYTVTPEEKVVYRERYGDLWRNGGVTYDKKGKRVSITQGVNELIRSRAYQLMSDEEKAKAIQNILTQAKTGATYEIMNHK